MATRKLFFSMFFFIFTLCASAQDETNPKLVNTFPTTDGTILVIDKWSNEIQVSDVKTEDLKLMEQTLKDISEQNEEHQKTIASQKKEISRLNQEISDLKKDYQSLLKSLENIERKLDDIERKLK